MVNLKGDAPHWCETVEASGSWNPITFFDLYFDAALEWARSAAEERGGVDNRGADDGAGGDLATSTEEVIVVLVELASDDKVEKQDQGEPMTPAQCQAARAVLALESQVGTVGAANLSSITFGNNALAPFNSSFSSTPDVNVPGLGPVQVDWFTDITAATGLGQNDDPYAHIFNTPIALAAYTTGKLIWTGARLSEGYPAGAALPFQDQAETNAAIAVGGGYGYEGIFAGALEGCNP